ncbi:putative hemolysin [Selenomonas ruminantium]|uniref:Putative hemolysin n=1 Tax=Selenomonas ruminantium TaxID=971 RepID=A0A1I3BQW6_SELRU|nr:putative hemolysin [Selenomonas ruminantium]
MVYYKQFQRFILIWICIVKKDVYFSLDSSQAGLLFLLLLLLLSINGFFSLIETAITESHRSRLERLQEDGNPDAEQALAILERPEQMLSLAQVGITLTSILTGLCTGVFLAPVVASLLPFLPQAHAVALVISIVAMTYITLLFSEFLPKKAAIQAPERVLLKYHRSLRLITRLTQPFITLLSGSANLILLIFGINPKHEDTVTEDEVKDLIEQGTEDGTFEKTEQAMVDRIFHMSDQTAYALMTPRTQMLWLDLSDSLKHNLRLIRETPQDVFPVGRDSLDDFCGILYAKDLLNASLERKALDLSLYIRKPLFVPRSMETFRVLEQFRDSGTHEAMVLDEYGGVIGFLTMDDILQEIIGDSLSTSEPDPVQLTVRDENSWLVDGLYSIDDFKERFDIDELPDEDHDHYQTMGGFLTSYFGYIPKAGEKKDWNGLTFEVVDMDRARIDKILITKTPAPIATE